MKHHILLSGNNAWGMWNFRKELVEHLIKKGFKISISAPYNQEYFEKFKEIGCDVYDIAINAKGINPIEDFLLIRTYYKLLKEIKPDLSITYTIKPNIYGSIAANKLGIKFLPITTGLGYTFLAKGIIPAIARKLYKFAFKKANEVWFLNQDDIKAFKEANLIDENKVIQLPGEGIDLTYFSPMLKEENEKITFLLVGRMLKDKGVIEFVEAARILKKKYPHTKFQLLGAIWSDNPAAIQKEDIDKWQREGVIEYLGQTKDVRPYIGNASCIVLPSYREGVPCTLMEGAAMGKPIVATNVPGCKEVVEKGYNGFLCEAKNSKDLAGKMEKMLLLSKEERAQMGNNGRSLMRQKFDIKLIIQQYDEAIDRILISE